MRRKACIRSKRLKSVILKPSITAVIIMTATALALRLFIDPRQPTIPQSLPTFLILIAV